MMGLLIRLFGVVRVICVVLLLICRVRRGWLVLLNLLPVRMVMMMLR